MSAVLGITAGANERKRIGGYSMNVHMPAMSHVKPAAAMYGYSPGTALAIQRSVYGTVYSLPPEGLGITIDGLNAVPAGQRSLAAQYFNWIFRTNANDRCIPTGYATLAAAVAANAISAQPVVSGSTQYKNVTGNDALPSGYSGVWMDNSMAGLLGWGASFAAALAAGGATLDHLMFDEEALPFTIAGSDVTVAHLTAIIDDPRFTTDSLPRLNAIITEATNGATTIFDAATWLASPSYGNPDSVAGLAWGAYVNEQMCKVMRALLDGIRTVFPNCTGSNYSYHGRSAAVTSAATSVSDLNGRLFYFTDVGDKWSSEFHYMEVNQQQDNLFSGKAVSYFGGFSNNGLAINPYHTLQWEHRRSWGGLESGRYLKPWLTFAGSDHSHFLGGIGAAAAADTCPYWQANNAMQLVLASVPQWIGTDWSPPGILYFVDENSTVNVVLYIGAVNVSGNEFLVHEWDKYTPDYTQTLRRGLLRSLIVAGSTSNNATYTVERSYYSDGGTSLSGSITSIVSSVVTLGGAPDLSGINLNTSDEPDRIILAYGTTYQVFLISAFDNTAKTVTLSKNGSAATPSGSPTTWSINRRWHHLVITEAIPSASGNLGNISTTIGDAHDALMNASVKEVSDVFGTVGPRKAIVHYPIIGQYDVNGVEDTARGNFIEWASARHGPNITYCIMIGRSRLLKSTWTSHAITGYVDGVSIGTVATVPANRAHVLYTRTYDPDEVLSFKWSYGGAEQAAPTNLLTSVDFTDISWTYDHGIGGATPSLSATYPSPVDASDTWAFYTGGAWASFAVTPGLEYTVSVCALYGVSAPTASAHLAVYKGSETVNLASNSDVWEGRLTASTPEVWRRLYLSFIAVEGETTYKMRCGLKNNAATKQYYCHPQAVQGILPGPIA